MRKRLLNFFSKSWIKPKRSFDRRRDMWIPNWRDWQLIDHTVEISRQVGRWISKRQKNREDFKRRNEI